MPLTDKIPPPTVIMFMIILSWSCQKKNVFTEKIVYNKSTFTSVAVFCLWVLVCVSYLKNAFIFCFVFFLEQCHELHTLQAPLMLIKIQNERIVVLVFCQRCVDFFKLFHTILNKNGKKNNNKKPLRTMGGFAYVPVLIFMHWVQGVFNLCSTQ